MQRSAPRCITGSKAWKLNSLFDVKHIISYTPGHEQAAPRQARPNPIDAVRRLVDAVDLPPRRCSINTVDKLLRDAGEAALAIP